MPSVRQQIVTQLLALLATIKVANGYNTNLGDSVHEYRPVTFEDRELPAVSVMDLSARMLKPEESQGNHLVQEYDLETHLIVFVSGASALTEVRKILDDIHRVIDVNYNLNGPAIYAEYTADELMIEQEKRRVVGADVTLTIRYRHNAYTS